VGLEDEPQGVVRVAMVDLEEVRQRLASLAGDRRQQDVAGERKIERGVGFAMAVFLPGARSRLVAADFVAFKNSEVGFHGAGVSLPGSEGVFNRLQIVTN
jgi:hypothetical protein